MDFTASEKNAYQSIADLLTILINHHINNFYPETEVEKIQNDLEVVLKNCALEEFVQDNSLLISCFLKNGFSYSKRKIVKVKTIQNFYQLLLNNDAMKKEIIIENLRTRLSLINIKSDFVDISDDDLPF